MIGEDERPKTLTMNISNPSQKWKLPVKLWIGELHEKRFGQRNHQAYFPLPDCVVWRGHAGYCIAAMRWSTETAAKLAA